MQFLGKGHFIHMASSLVHFQRSRPLSLLSRNADHNVSDETAKCPDERPGVSDPRKAKPYLEDMLDPIDRKLYRGVSAISKSEENQCDPLRVFREGLHARDKFLRRTFTWHDLENHIFNPGHAIDRNRACLISMSPRKSVAINAASKSLELESGIDAGADAEASLLIVYTVMGRHEGIEVNKQLGPHPYEYEEEIAIPGSISGYHIPKAKNPLTREIWYNAHSPYLQDAHSSSDEEYDEKKGE